MCFRELREPAQLQPREVRGQLQECHRCQTMEGFVENYKTRAFHLSEMRSIGKHCLTYVSKGSL